MTIRARLTLTQTMIAAVVIALCVLAIGLARMASQLSRMPALHMAALDHIHDLFDSVGQAVKDINDVAKGQEDPAQLDQQMARARDALGEILEGDHVELPRDIADEIVSAFAEFERAEREIQTRAKAGDHDGARALLGPLGEQIYEGRVHPALERIEAYAVSVASTIGSDGADRAQLSLFVAVLLVLIGIVGTAIATVIVIRIQRRLSALASTAAAVGGDVQHVRSSDVTARDELGDLGRAFNHMADDVARLIETTAAKEALASELALAARMQQALLPPAPEVAGLEIAGAMSTMTQVGGDYYDVLPVRDGAWIAIGDVSGHGFNTGIVTLLAQSAIASVTGARADAGPAEVLGIVNNVLHDLVRVRLGLRDHMTLTLLRYRHDGTVEFAGAHQEILVRGADGNARTIDTSGPWLAVAPDISRHLVAGRFALAEGETMVLFTDGVVEARSDAGDMFGLDRLIAAVAELPVDASAQVIRDAVFARVRAVASKLEDDATVLAIRRLAPATELRAAS